MHLVVCFFWFFGACAGLVTLTSQNIDRHQKNKKNQKFQQLLRSGPIVPGNFSFLFFVGACAGLVHLVVCLFFLMLVQVWCIYWFVYFFDACAGFGDSRLCMFGSWPYFKLMFQRSKHTVIFE